MPLCVHARMWFVDWLSEKNDSTQSYVKRPKRTDRKTHMHISYTQINKPNHAQTHAPQHRGEQHAHGHAPLRLTKAQPDQEEEEGDAQVERAGEAEPLREGLREGCDHSVWRLVLGGGGVEAAAAVACWILFGGIGGHDVVEEGCGVVCGVVRGE